MTAQIETHRFTAEDAARVVPRRGSSPHKWDVGGVFIVAGSQAYPGAAALCAMAAGRAGAGIVSLAAPGSVLATVMMHAPEAIFTPLPEGEIGSAAKLFSRIGDRAERCRAFLIGPGLGIDRYATDLVHLLLGLRGAGNRSGLGFGSTATASSIESDASQSLLSYGHPIVVDADALSILASSPDWSGSIPDNRLVLTPHVGEMARLLDASIADVTSAPDAAAVEASRRFRQVVVLKGSPSMVAIGTTVYPAAIAPKSLATAGSGDVLAGTIAALLAQGLSPTDAANLAIYAGTQAATALEMDLGELGVVAGDLPRAIAVALASLT